ncbi:MAG: TerB family tellurite resistance protein [Micavibrio sp.]|nr:MAG: TerB family tellurite resistance protein [Micavibrio sp.]
MLHDHKIKSFWQKLTGLVGKKELSKEEICQEENLRLSVAALLVHVAAADDDFDKTEHLTIRTLLSNEFDLTGEMLDELVDEAKTSTEEAADLYGFVRNINNTLDQEGRQEIVKMLWQVVFADGKIKHNEDSLMRKICHLLGVVWHDSVLLKEEVYAAHAAKKN